MYARAIIMKLYAQTQSERAGKGQGGNKEMTTVYTIEHDTKEREEIARVSLTKDVDTFTMRVVPVTGDATVYRVPIKRQ